MNEIKLYRVVTFKIECDNWSSGSGGWVNNEYYEIFSARRVLCDDGWCWQVVDCGTLGSNREVKYFIYRFDYEELLNCVVNESVWPKDIIFSGYFKSEQTEFNLDDNKEWFL